MCLSQTRAAAGYRACPMLFYSCWYNGSPNLAGVILVGKWLLFGKGLFMKRPFHQVYINFPPQKWVLQLVGRCNSFFELEGVYIYLYCARNSSIVEGAVPAPIASTLDLQIQKWAACVSYLGRSLLMSLKVDALVGRYSIKNSSAKLH